jgi:hypothetical protein
MVSEIEIDAGAQALRDRQIGGRVLTPWQKLPKATKRKWRDHAAAVLTAAVSAKLAASAIKERT